MIHQLKSRPAFFRPILNRSCRFDIRINDRPFKVDDLILFREYMDIPEYEVVDSHLQIPLVSEGFYTGREVTKKIRMIEPSTSQPDHVVLFFLDV